MQRSNRLVAALALVAALVGPGALAAAEKKDFGAPNQDYLDQKAELENMITSRDVELYEMNFQVLELDRVLLKDRTGRERVFNYLTFRLRNEITDDTKQLAAKATRYNEILQNTANQYEALQAKVENGVTLKVAGEEILDRKDMHSRERTVSLTVLAYDENGSRIRLIDEVPGTGPQEQFNFADLGEPSVGTASRRVREKVEEKAGRRLLTVDEIRKLKLPPYDATKLNEEGVAAGEVYGVLLFNRLSIYGDQFTIEVRGLSNKFRVRQPDTPKGGLDNFLASRVLRRVYVLHYSRPGDEYFEDLHKFTLVKSGWEWINTFQRIDQRSTVAYVRYFLSNIASDKGERNPKIEEDFWPYYSKVREKYATSKWKDKLPDTQATLKDH